MRAFESSTMPTHVGVYGGGCPHPWAERSFP